uniref:phospholipase A2 n=1 Tax=Seriola lalandi dorsalis TaxID=1841481 RepID=A0A3B4XAK3_SERLL
MQSRVLQQVIFSLSWLILSKAQDVIGSGLSCLRYSPADADGQTRITFLREDAAGARSLYLTLWSEDMRLLTCEVTSSPLATERYGTLCDRSGTQSQEITRRLNISVLSAPDAPCALVSSSAPKFPRRTRRDGTEGKARRKRAWILPGTLWCGKGNEAVRYEQLGMFEDADRCCREHDHCLHIIPAFTVNYGVFNPNLYTVSHCDCDQRFRRCLQDVNDTVSSMVGYSFFNILRVPCFELKTQRRCTQIYWWGMCKVAKQAPYAVFKNPLPYNTSDVANKYLNNTRSNKLTSEVTKSHVIGPCRKSQKCEHRCGSRDPPRQDTFYRRGTKGKGCKTHCKLSTVAPPQMPPLSQAHTTTPSMITGLLNPSKNNQLLCGSFKHLDECKYQIPPLQRKYDLQNMESKTAYHCGCTSRFPLYKRLLGWVLFLIYFVCFFSSCSGGFIKASDLLRALKKIEEKDTAGVRNSGNDRKRGNPVRLYKRCLRLEREADIMAQLT